MVTNASSVRVGCLCVDATVANDVLVRVLWQTPAASHVPVLVTVNQVLL